MKANTLSPMEIFGNQIRYVVPLYQRPYVWNQKEQWEPLWEDMRTLAERVLEHPVGYGVPPVSPHFLGAIVLDQLLSSVNLIGSRAVIDGQQRLTTLQLLLDAAQLVVARHGRPIDAESLKVLIANNPAIATDPDHIFKVWPTDRDQAAFRAAMDDDAVPTAAQAATSIAKAHAFFERVMTAWALEQDSERSTEERLGALAEALRQHLRLVVIDLEPGDNAQVIFETLNHRGAPLLAADLIKNLVFQVATAQGLDAAAMYEQYWKELDGDYWRQVIAQGRLYRPRIDVFMHRWLVMTLKREVKADRVFTDFRDNVILVDGVDVQQVLKTLAADAAVHRSWESLPVDSVAGLFRYRVLQAMDSQVFAPLFLWLTRFPDSEMPREQQEKALSSIESWVVRRMLARVTTKDYNNVVLDLLTALDRTGPARAGDTVERFLSDASAESRFWPSDETVRANLWGERVYRTMTRPRARMILEALEDAARTELGEGQPAPRNLTIEHVMPQGWREYWDDAADPTRAERRDELIHTLGNLSLVTGRLNPALSNRPWSDAEAKAKHLGSKGKRDYLLQHSNLKLNARLVHEHPDTWDEDSIVARTEDAIESLIRIWPAPKDAVQPDIVVHQASAAETAEPITDDSDWAVGEGAIQDAERLWSEVSPVANRLLMILSSVSPERIGADDLAEALAVESGPAGVAEIVAAIGQRAARLGRPSPVSWQEGAPPAYWMAPDVSATLVAGCRPRGASAVSATTTRERQEIRGSLAPLLERGLVAVGDTLRCERLRTGEVFTATITADGRLETLLGVYGSPSPALSDLAGSARNGWSDWVHEATAATLAELRAAVEG
ncbi:GmrSD restriction endonuclease domain-containing protein [Nocardioides ultimimeridianus]